MGYDVSYSRAAERYLDTQTNATRKRIMDAIDDLPEGEEPGNKSGIVRQNLKRDLKAVIIPPSGLLLCPDSAYGTAPI